MFLCMRAAVAVDDSLIPGLVPHNTTPPPHLAEVYCLCTLTDGDQTEERRVGTLRVCSGFLVRWKGLCSPFWCDGVSHVLHCSEFLSEWSWIMSPPIFLICAHTIDTCKADAVFSLGPCCHQNYMPQCWTFLSSQMGAGGRGGSKQLLCKRQEQVNRWRKNRSGGRERGVGWNELEREVTSV